MAQFKLGRNRPVAIGPRLKLQAYMAADLPDPPAAHAWSSQAWRALKRMYMNDKLGCCVISGMAHTAGVVTGNASNGQPVTFSDDQIVELYSEIGGYRGTPQTDNGCDEQTALNYWQDHGLFGHEIDGWVSVDGTDRKTIETAIWLFENVVFGLELPNAWVDPMPMNDGFHWDVAGEPNPDNGHCFVGVGYDHRGVHINTWGLLGTISWEAIAKYATTRGAGELYSVLSPEMVAKGTQKAPNGFAWNELTADFAKIG